MVAIHKSVFVSPKTYKTIIYFNVLKAFKRGEYTSA